MRPERVAASRAATVLRAARAWEKSGIIAGPTRAAIEDEYPSGGHAHAPAWKVVVFVVTSVAILAAFLAFMSVLHGSGAATWLFCGAVLAVVTEALDRSSYEGNGAAGATSFWAIVMISAGFAALTEGRPGGSYEVEIGLFIAMLAFAVACWRWGFEAYGPFGAAAFFAFLTQFPGGRAMWIAAALVLLPVTFRLLDRVAVAPEHRAAAAGVFGASAIALYVAVNSYSVDRRMIEELIDFHGGRPAAAVRVGAAIATAVVPLFFLAWGIRTRRRLILDLGAVFAILSLATLRHYVHIAPLWAILCAAGAALLLAALALNRKLRNSPGGEWRGFTAHPLYSRDAGSFAAAAVVAGFAPEARLPQPPESGGFTGGGGRSGGGGAAGSF